MHIQTILNQNENTALLLANLELCLADHEKPPTARITKALQMLGQARPLRKEAYEANRQILDGLLMVRQGCAQ